MKIPQCRGTGWYLGMHKAMCSESTCMDRIKKGYPHIPSQHLLVPGTELGVPHKDRPCLLVLQPLLRWLQSVGVGMSSPGTNLWPPWSMPEGKQGLPHAFPPPPSFQPVLKETLCPSLPPCHISFLPQSPGPPGCSPAVPL